MIKHLCYWLCLLGTAWNAHAQSRTPAKWVCSVSQVSASEADLIFTATLEEGWHIYSQHIGNDGPMPTSFAFAASAQYTSVDSVKEYGKPINTFDETFLMPITWYDRSVVFIQRIKLHTPQTTVKGKIEYMTCDRQMCVPATYDFSLDVKVSRPAKNNGRGSS